ncbi:FecR family protein [Snuella sedimenti]|uniref:FecR family protein n=1 Tax=Snuella sedimenti TaxID=2798802 RepID=A0A8J7IF64_9FLAO|nr:FecR family protein [Snuella sedimenti]MBJ6367457.1 FecR family protein [Snuella sedimenti]
MTMEIEVNRLIIKFIENKLLDHEYEILEGLLRDPKNRLLFDELVEIHFLISPKTIHDLDSLKSYKKLLKKVEDQRFNRRQPKKRPFVVFKYAALFIGIIGLTYAVILQNGLQSNPISPPIEIEDEAITLQLENGKIEKINTERNTQIVEANGEVVVQQQKDKLVYTGKANSEELLYNTLNIPYGKKFQLELSDGTVVHLNSGSSLKYPVTFLEGQDRNVYVKGEAFFKVAEDAKHPFIVNVNTLCVRVLGTEFNVSSYEEDSFINTVLVSGEVRLYDRYSSYNADTSLKLTPNHMAVWNKDQHNMSVKEVNTGIYTGWVEGKLIFREMQFKEITKKLERHYNVSIINKNDALNEHTFNASFDVESIQEVLEVFKINFGIEYEIVNNEIIIY